MKLRNAFGTTAIVCALLIVPGQLQAKSMLAIGMQQEPSSLDPTADATASIDGMLAHNVYESLTTVAEDGGILPKLATGWTVSDDGLTYTFDLAKGVTFHDGTTFDAEDVKFTFDRAMAEDSTNPSKGIWKPIQSVNVLDPHRVEVKLEYPDGFLLFNLAQGDASIVAPESVDGNAATPVGTGPFAFGDWTRGDRLTLKKYADHRNADDVQMETIEFRFISDPAAASNALLAGELDAFPGFPAPELLEQFEADPRFRVSSGETQGEVILAMNNSRPLLSDIRVRRAISHALNRQEIIDGAMYGKATPIGTFFPPSDKAAIDLTGLYPHSIEKARKLLSDAEVADGTRLVLRVPPFPYATRSGEIIQAQLAAAGFDVDLETVEWSFWLDRVYRNKDYDMTIIAHTSPNDLGNFARGKDYFYGYQDDAFDALWDSIKTEADPARREELLKEGQRFVADQAVHGYLFMLPKLGVYKNEVGGFWRSSPVLFQPLSEVVWND